MKSPFTNLNQLFEDLAATLRIRAFRLHLGMYLGGYISQDILNGVLSYIIAFVFLGSVATTSQLTTWMAMAQLFSVGRHDLARAAHSRRALVPHRARLCSPPASSASPRSTCRASGSLRVSRRACVVAGLGRGALNYIPWSVYNYMPDVDEIVTGRRREGAFAGVMTFVRKLMQSAAIFIVSQILNFAGLVPGVKIQPVEVVNTAVTIMVVGALGVMLFGFFVSLRFRLKRDTHAVLMEEIERFKTKAGHRADAREPAHRRGSVGLEVRRALGSRPKGADAPGEKAGHSFIGIFETSGQFLLARAMYLSCRSSTREFRATFIPGRAAAPPNSTVFLGAVVLVCTEWAIPGLREWTGRQQQHVQAPKNGVDDGTRTHDSRDHNPGLYQLSYAHH